MEPMAFRLAAWRMSGLGWTAAGWVYGTASACRRIWSRSSARTRTCRGTARLSRSTPHWRYLSLADLSLSISQKFGDNVTISLGKFNMLDAASTTPLIGGGGETTFWNLGLAAPISGVTPAYIVGGILSVKTTPATLTLMVYDPRNAQDLS